MLPESVLEKVQQTVSMPTFSKSLSFGENWKSKSMRMIPENFVRRTFGAFEHRVVLCDRWGDSWQLWLERDKNGLLFMVKEDWDEFVDDNHLGPNHVLFFHHQDTMFLQVGIFHKDDDKEIISSSFAPLQVEPESEPLHVKPLSSHQDTTSASASASASASGSANGLPRPVLNPESYLKNPKSPYFVKTITKKNDVLYVSRPAIHKYGLKFGPVNSSVNFILKEGTVEEGCNKIYGYTPCFGGWLQLCRKYNLKLGDSLVCELERSGDGVVNAVRLHLVKE